MERNKSSEPTKNQVSQINAAIERTALRHLNSKSATSALDYYTEDARIMSNGRLYPSFESFAADVENLYRNLNAVNHAEYSDIQIHVLTSKKAHFSTKFNWISTDIHGKKIEINGTWSALFVRIDEKWKMCFRHESFQPV